MIKFIVGIICGFATCTFMFSVLQLSHGLTRTQMVDSMMACGDKNTIVKRAYTNGLIECEKNITLQLDFNKEE